MDSEQLQQQEEKPIEASAADLVLPPDDSKKTSASGAVDPSCTPAQAEFRPLTNSEWYGIALNGVYESIGRGKSVFCLKGADNTLSGVNGVSHVYYHVKLGRLGKEGVYLSPGEEVVFVEGVDTSCTVYLGTVTRHGFSTMLLMTSVSSNECKLVNPETVVAKLRKDPLLDGPTAITRVNIWMQEQRRDNLEGLQVVWVVCAMEKVFLKHFTI